jgi:hypothetical protein
MFPELAVVIPVPAGPYRLFAAGSFPFAIGAVMADPHSMKRPPPVPSPAQAGEVAQP